LKTNRPADGQVEYGLTPSYGNRVWQSLLFINQKAQGTLTHQVQLYPLERGTTYHFRVKSADAEGNTVVSEDYTFTTHWAEIKLPLPREINQINCIQSTESWKITHNIPPSETVEGTDEHGNVSKTLFWDSPAKEIIASLEVIVSRKVNIISLNDIHPYPIPDHLLPENADWYLQPTSLIQSTDPKIVELAKSLAEGLTSEAEVVNKTVLWVSQNIQWKCSREWLNREDCEKYGYRWVGDNIYEPIDPKVIGAVWTLKYKIGVCSNFAELATALLRAQGIPVRQVSGFVADPDDPNLKEADAGHAWIEVYYPAIGWVDYDPGSGMIHLPHYIVFAIQAGYGVVSGGDFTEKWQAIGLGNNRVKIIYTIILSVRE